MNSSVLPKKTSEGRNVPPKKIGEGRKSMNVSARSTKPNARGYVPRDVQEESPVSPAKMKRKRKMWIWVVCLAVMMTMVIAAAIRLRSRKRRKRRYRELPCLPLAIVARD